MPVRAAARAARSTDARAASRRRRSPASLAARAAAASMHWLADAAAAGVADRADPHLHVELAAVAAPIDQLAELMERRGKALGARPAASANLGRTDGFRQIAEALRDLVLGRPSTTARSRTNLADQGNRRAHAMV